MADYLVKEDGFYLLLEDDSRILLETGGTDVGFLEGLVLHSNYPAFINKSELSGTLTISGSTARGTNTQTFTIDLGSAPDLVDVMFNGPFSDVFVSTPADARPDTAWFRQGSIAVPTDGAGDPSRWFIFSKVVGTDLVVTAIYVQTFTGTETLTATDFDYKIVDYSVFG